MTATASRTSATRPTPSTPRRRTCAPTTRGRDANGLRGAIYRYNHANWYVELVLNIAAQLAQRYGEPAPPPYVPVV